MTTSATPAAPPRYRAVLLAPLPGPARSGGADSIASLPSAASGRDERLGGKDECERLPLERARADGASHTQVVDHEREGESTARFEASQYNPCCHAEPGAKHRANPDVPASALGNGPF